MKNRMNEDEDIAIYEARLDLRAENTQCDMCKKKFNEWDAQENFGCNINVGYGSKYDTKHIKMNLCCDCFDKLFDKEILPNCKENPITEEEYDYCGAIGAEEEARIARIESFLGGDISNELHHIVSDEEITDEFLDQVEERLKKEGYSL